MSLKAQLEATLVLARPVLHGVPSSLIGLQSKCSMPARFRTRCHL